MSNFAENPQLASGLANQAGNPETDSTATNSTAAAAAVAKDGQAPSLTAAQDALIEVDQVEEGADGGAGRELGTDATQRAVRVIAAEGQQQQQQEQEQQQQQLGEHAHGSCCTGDGGEEEHDHGHDHEHEVRLPCCCNSPPLLGLL